MLAVGQASFEQREQIGQFIHSTYGEKGRFKFPERWDWMFKRNPFQGQSGPTICIASDADHLIAQFCAMAVRMRLHSEEIPAYWGLDFMVSEAYRGGVLGKLMLEKLHEHCDPLIALWSHPSTRKLYMLLGGELACSVIQFEKLTLQSLTENVVDGAPPAMDDIEMTQVDCFGAEVDELWERISPLYSSLVVRNSTYLNWKFTSVPFAKYWLYVARINGVIQGYAILRRSSPPELSAGMIADVFASPRDTRVLTALYRFSSRFLECQRVDSLVAASSHPAHQRILQELGYFPTRRMPVDILWKGGTAKCRVPGDAGASWLIGRADSDWDQHPAGLSQGALSAGNMAEPP